MPEVSLFAKEQDARSYWCSRIFLASWIAYAGFYFCRRNIGWTPLPASSDSHYGFANFADLLFLFGLGYAFGLFVAGWLADRYSARSTLVFGGLLSVLCTSVISPGMPVSFIIALQALNGLGQGFGWPAVNKLLSVWFPRGERAVILAWWSTSYALGGFLATALAEGLSTIGSVSIATGARLAIIVPSLILLLAIGYFYLRTKDSPEQVGLHAVNGPSADDAERTSFVRSWKPILHNREIQLLAAMYFFLKMTRYALLFWLPVYLVQTQHASNYAALSTSSLFELTGFIGALVAAYVSDRLLQGRRYPVGATMMFLAAFAFLLHPLVSTASRGAMAVSICAIGMLIYGSDVLMATTAVLDAVPPAQAGRASAYVNGIGSVGQMLSPLLVMQLVRWLGWNSVFNVFVMCSLAAGVLLATRWDRPASGISAAGITTA